MRAAVLSFADSVRLPHPLAHRAHVQMCLELWAAQCLEAGDALALARVRHLLFWHRHEQEAVAQHLLDRLLRMAVPKKKVSYTRKRKRIAGFQAIRGPKLKTHMYLCPVWCVPAPVAGR